MQKKEFSILKWIVFPANSIVLAAIIAYFNITVFGLRDGLPYSIIVGMIGLFSIVIVRYAESENRSLARAAFVFEIILTVALIINAVYSVSVQRKMSVAKMAETNQKETIGEISKLKGSRTQREALKKIDKQETAQTVFTGVENILFWIMAAELALYGLSAFTLFALAKLIGDDSETESKTKTVTERDFIAMPASSDLPRQWPQEIDAEKRALIERGNCRQNPPEFRQGVLSVGEPENSQGVNRRDLMILRRSLRDVAHYLPKQGFKADKSGDGVIVRHFSYDNEEKVLHSVKFSVEQVEEFIRMTLTKCFSFLASLGFAVRDDLRRYIYFIRKKGTDEVKIGISEAPANRLLQLQHASGTELEIVRTVPGHEGLEKRLHQHFADKRLKGEWFKIAQPEIDAVIKKIQRRLVSGEPL